MFPITDDTYAEKIRSLQKFYYDLLASDRNNKGLGVVQFEGAPLLEHIHVRNGRLFVNRQAMLATLALKQSVGAEVGVLKGDLSDFILRTLKPKELHLLDLDFDTHKVEERFLNEIGDGQVTLVKGDSSTELARYPDGHFDWIYVDGDHSYSGCKKDFVQAIVKIKGDGFIFANDYIFWSHTECRPYGVVHAVNELCVKHGFEIAGFAMHPAMYCDVALRRRDR